MTKEIHSTYHLSKKIYMTCREKCVSCNERDLYHMSKETYVTCQKRRISHDERDQCHMSRETYQTCGCKHLCKPYERLLQKHKTLAKTNTIDSCKSNRLLQQQKTLAKTKTKRFSRF